MITVLGLLKVVESAGSSKFMLEKQHILPKKKIVTLVDHLTHIKCKEIISQSWIPVSQEAFHV